MKNKRVNSVGGELYYKRNLVRQVIQMRENFYNGDFDLEKFYKYIEERKKNV